MTEAMRIWQDAYAASGATRIQDREAAASVIAEAMAERDAEIARLREALEFYADPETYHACLFRFDPPTGGFDEDFDEGHGHEDYERPMPGKRARQALEATNGTV